ncbi:HAD family hydrolase [Nanoarchaeota archaeon]
MDAVQKEMIKAIIFDIGGVITHPGITRPYIEKVSKRFKVSFKDAEGVIRRNMSDGQTGKITFDEFINKIAKRIKLKNSVALKRIALGMNKVNKSKYEILRRLRKKYKVYALTNHMQEWFEYERDKYGLAKYFHKIFASYEIGVLKPHPKIYKTVLKHIKLKPNQCIFIDNLGTNTGGAKKLGFNAIRFESNTQLKQELKKLGVEI